MRHKMAALYCFIFTTAPCFVLLRFNLPERMHQSTPLLTIDERPMRFAWAPGGYIRTCSHCEKQFVGDKRAMICAPCAYNDAGMAELLKDKARLDWLDTDCPNYAVGRTINAPENPDPEPFAFTYGLGSRKKSIPFRGSVRNAIDRARKP